MQCLSLCSRFAIKIHNSGVALTVRCPRLFASQVWCVGWIRILWISSLQIHYELWCGQQPRYHEFVGHILTFNFWFSTHDTIAASRPTTRSPIAPSHVSMPLMRLSKLLRRFSILCLACRPSSRFHLTRIGAAQPPNSSTEWRNTACVKWSWICRIMV